MLLLRYVQNVQNESSTSCEEDDTKTQLWDCMPYGKAVKTENRQMNVMSLMQIFIIIAAIVMAYRANSKSRNDIEATLAIVYVAASFPEIYITQAFIRWCLGTYSL